MQQINRCIVLQKKKYFLLVFDIERFEFKAEQKLCI